MGSFPLLYTPRPNAVISGREGASCCSQAPNWGTDQLTGYLRQLILTCKAWQHHILLFSWTWNFCDRQELVQKYCYTSFRSVLKKQEFGKDVYCRWWIIRGHTRYNKLFLTNKWFVSYFPNKFIRKASIWLLNSTLFLKYYFSASKNDNSTLKTKANIFRHPCKDKNKQLRDRTRSVCAIHTSVFQGEWHYREVPFSLQDVLRCVTLVPIVPAWWWLLLTHTTAADPLCSYMLLNSVPGTDWSLNLLQLPPGDLKGAKKMQQPEPCPWSRSMGKAPLRVPNLRDRKSVV